MREWDVRMSGMSKIIEIKSNLESTLLSNRHNLTTFFVSFEKFYNCNIICARIPFIF
jgi:hypothetical protein